MTARPLDPHPPTRWHLGSSRMLSWEAFLSLLVFSLVFSLVSNPRLIGLGLALPMLVSVASLSTIFATIWLARLTVMKDSDGPPRRATVVAVYFVASLVRCLVNAWLLTVVGVLQPGQMLGRVVVSLPCFLAALIVIDASLGAVDEHRRTMALLVEQEAAARAARDTSLREFEARRASARDVVRTEILSILNDMDADEPAALVTRLRGAVDDVVRPLSHEIRPAERHAGEEPRRPGVEVDGRSVLADATSDGALRPFAIAVALSVIGVVYVVLSLPPMQALIEMTLAIVGTWALLTVAGRLGRPWLVSESIPVRVVALTVVLIASGALLALVSLAILGNSEVTARLGLAYLLLVPLLGWGLALSQASDRQRRRLESAQRYRTSQMDWQATRARGAAWQQEQELAQTLHGPVQGALGAAAIRLSLALQDNRADEQVVDQVRADVQVALDALEPADGDVDGVAHLERALQDAASTWHGSCEITWHVEEAARQLLVDDPVCARLASDIATEACWNAIRHGHARAVDVAFGIGDNPAGSITVIATDDGDDYDALAAPGLGTRMLDEVCLEWSRERLDRRTLLRADLPCAPALSLA